VDLDAGIADRADGDRQGEALQQRKVDVDIEVAPFQWTVCQLAVYVLVMAACMSAS
jgi:hypothetical protein